MIDICPLDKCTGCAACMNACPKDAISMQEKGIMGYIYPVINQDLCIDCHLCERTCPVNNPISLANPRKAFAAKCKDEEDLMTSTSGGASSAFVQYILSQDGVVYGCVQNNYTDIAHRRIESSEEAYRLKGSKYVQSNIGYIYRTVKQDLQKGIKVLFTGTPCQIAGLKKYLKKNYENLYLVDLVCHGVPSQKILQDNVRHILKSKSSKPYIDFRSKGLYKYGVLLRNEPDVKIKSQIFPKNDYIAAFMSGIIFRKNCFSCLYSQSLRGSDVTIGDFWGLSKESSISDEKGVSLMLANTEKGEALIRAVSTYCDIEERPVIEAISGNGQLQKPSEEPEYRDEFIALYAKDKEKAFSIYLKDYRTFYKRNQLKNKLRNILVKNPTAFNCIKSVYKKIK